MFVVALNAVPPLWLQLTIVAGGFLLLLPLVPGNDAWSHNLPALGFAFIAFRGFDIAKPWPIRGLQRFGGGLGILIDDLAAGALAAIVTQLLVRIAL